MNSFDHRDKPLVPSYVKTKLALPRIFDDYLVGQILKWGAVLQGHLVEKQGDPGMRLGPQSDYNRTGCIIVGTRAALAKLK